MQKISYRTQVLLHIFEFQKEHGRGIGFNELVEKTKLDRVIVSKSFDSLWDMGIIEDIMDGHDGEIDGVYHKKIFSKVIVINNNFWKFVEMIYNDLMEG